MLGISLVVSFSDAVTADQQQQWAASWSRCLHNNSIPPGRVENAFDGLPFTAALSFNRHGVGTDTRQVRAASFASLCERITSQVTLIAIEMRAGAMTMLHACGVADDSGAVLALVAESGTGKTTAASHLAQTFGYVTDETVAIKADGAVLPYPKPLSVVAGGRGEPKRQVGPDELGLKPVRGHLRIRAIGLLDRVEEMRTPEIARVPLLDAVVELIPQTSSQSAIEKPLQSLCELILKIGGVRRITYSEAADLEVALSDEFFAVEPGEQCAAAKWTPADIAGSDDHVPKGWLRRKPAIDAVECEGDLLILNGLGVTRLTGIGPAIWRHSAQALTEGELLQLLEAEFGLPRDSGGVLEDVLEELKSRELISRGPGASFWEGRTALGLINVGS
ncbi:MULTISPECIES: PqqD family protein [unclassified Pseudarthrobacter]|uniref:PqqD family protein n=1 Tax=unclassified Pseudarthrobacter TaxID=2647000 RepID=UPI00363260FC